MEDKLTTVAQSLNVGCPFCGAPKGEACNNSGGGYKYSTTYVHKPRTELAERVEKTRIEKRVPRQERLRANRETDLSRENPATPSENGHRVVEAVLDRDQANAAYEANVAKMPYFATSSSEKTSVVDSSERHERINTIIWGLTFARDVLKMSQMEIDTKIAEAFVDNNIVW
jgi:hypothetical protein